MMKLLAATTPIDFGPLKGIGPLGTPQDSGITNLSTVISTALGVMTIVAFLIFLFQIITGAISWMNAGGDKALLETSRKKILNAIIGVVAVIAAVFLVSLIGTIFGIDFLNITKLFYQLPGVSGGRTAVP